MAEGAIHDLKYKRYTGTRGNPWLRALVVARWAMALQLRQRWVKVLFGLGILWATGSILKLAMLSLFQSSAAGEGIPARLLDLDVKVGADAIAAQQLPTFLLVLACGAPALAADLNAGAFQFHFARPVGVAQYLLGRLLGAAGWSLVLSFGTFALLFCVRLVLGGDAGTVVKSAALAAGPLALRVLCMTAVALGLSSLTRRKALAQAMFAGLVVGSWVFLYGLGRVSHRPWIAALHVTGAAEALGDMLLVHQRYGGWHDAVPAAASALWLALGLGLAAWRLSRAEVVRG
jgi:ABC-type transport system involved in multi-copper enzyme maturation permease subunit